MSRPLWPKLSQPCAGPRKSGNIAGLLLDNPPRNCDGGRVVIEYQRTRAQCRAMKHIAILVALVACLAAPAAAGAETCYADYKAKQDKPLRLHYGVAQINGACRAKAAQAELAGRLGQNGWTLLNVVSVFGPEGLNERKANAGSYFLRF